MKKYLLGLVAITLAIGFTAFTPKQKSAAAGLQKRVDLYWYSYDQANDKVVGTLIAHDDAGDVKTGTCTEDSGTDECMRGFENELSSGQIGTSPAPSGPGHIFEEDNH